MVVATAASLSFLLAAAWCVERLARAPRAWRCLPSLPVLGATWAALWWIRLPPTPEQALLAFGLADLAVLAISTAAVMRLLGGFDHLHANGEDEDGPGDDEGEPDPMPSPPTRPTRRPVRPTGRARSARGSASRGPSRSSSARSARARS